MPLSSLSIMPTIDMLKYQYTSGSIFVSKTGSCSFGRNMLPINVAADLTNVGFFGSYYAVSAYAGNSINMEAPGCFAACLVNLIARQTINLGVSGRGEEVVPVRIFAPEMFSATTDNLQVGEIKFWTDPKRIVITCRKLTLIQRGDEGVEAHEVLKAALLRDDTEVEVVQRQ